MTWSEGSAVVADAARATLLIDASSVAYRVYAAMPPVTAPDGTLVSAPLGFMNALARLLVERRPARLFVAVELGEDWRPKFRVALLPSYKSHRVAGPDDVDDFSPQIAILIELLEAFGITVAKASECEAEDVIATLAGRLDGRVEIVSGDRDLFSLVRDPDVRVLYTLRGVSELATVDESWIHAKYGIPGDRYLDYAILRGDPSDGLPGVRGIGEKSAALLVTRYGSLDAVLSARDLSPSISAKLRAAKEYLAAARRVVSPVRDCAVAGGDGTVPRAPANPGRLIALARRYALEASVRRLTEALAV